MKETEDNDNEFCMVVKHGYFNVRDNHTLQVFDSEMLRAISIPMKKVVGGK
jgi:hypothetical protein